MVEPKLELAQHEIPPKGRRERDEAPFLFEAACFGTTRTFVGRSISEDQTNILFFCLPDEPERGHFVCAGGSAETAQPEFTWSSGSTTSLLTKGIKAQKWGRYFVLNEAFEPANGNDGVYTLFLCSTGRGMLTCINHSSARFRWSSPCVDEVWQTPPFELLRRVIESKDASGEVNFAFRWAKCLIRPRNVSLWSIHCDEVPTKSGSIYVDCVLRLLLLGMKRNHMKLRSDLK
ncbi:hypothetical protein IAD21_00115 [Abditibacteriota bacterium]|nr:hypothetical protein IAD21_00115 [Abditibacteriota bacterium]